MRGTPDRQDAIYHTFNVEDRIEPEHPLRPIKRMVDSALAGMSRTFKAAHSGTGRPEVPPETLLKALLLQRLSVLSRRHSSRSDRIVYFDHSVFTHNRDRLADHGITQKFFDSVVKQALEAGLTSDEHFTVDGSLIQSHASLRASRRSSGRRQRRTMTARRGAGSCGRPQPVGGLQG